MSAPIPPQLDALELLRMENDQLQPASSMEIEERTSLLPQEQEGALGQQELLALPQAPEDQTQTKNLLGALYGDHFPLLMDNAEEEDWVRWVELLWERHSAAVSSRLHMVRRNRLFRRGVQWISSSGLGPWREPPKPRDAARVVDNMVGPALDQRLQLLTEQRPGFRTRPATSSPNDIKKAEAQQFALEYQWDQQQVDECLRELAYWAGTDGVSFGELYWDADAGPWSDMLGAPAPMGEIRMCVRKIEQVRVSAEATATHKPWYWVVKDVLPKAAAIRQYGSEIMKEVEESQGDSGTEMGSMTVGRLGYVLPDDDELYRDQETVDRFTVYCDRTEFLPQGLTLIVVGRKLVMLGGLLIGKPPIFRFTDGSTDPSFFPNPIMDAWIDSQMRVNAVKSKWVENVRLNAGARLIAKENAISGETLVGGTMSVIGIKGLGGVSDVVKELQGFSLAEDAEKLLLMEKKCFEDLSGWNDTSRGSFSADQSGRAILAIREQLERIFAPPIAAAARAMTEWAELSLGWMQWGYDLPRTLGVVGEGRPDLARELSAKDFDGVADVFIDPETLTPMPRALRLFMLQDMLGRGLMSPQEYRRRMPFGWVRSISSPDEDHEARARRVVEAIRQSGNPQALPMLWQDNEAIHQDVLERELILPDDTDPMIRMAANQRWMMLAQQAQMKMGPMMAMGGGAPAPGGQNGKPPQMGAGEQPILGSNPSIAAAPVSQISSTDQQSAGAGFDARSQR